MSFFGREPAVWTGIIVSCVLAVLSVLTGQGVVSDAVAGRITDATNAIAQLVVTVLLPVITAILIRPQVSPLTPRT